MNIGFRHILDVSRKSTLNFGAFVKIVLQKKFLLKIIFYLLLGVAVLALLMKAGIINFPVKINFDFVVVGFVFSFTLLLTFQGAITLTWMLYAWNNPDEIAKAGSPDTFSPPHYSFTAIVPVRFEGKVIKDTIKTISRINYPSYLKEIIVICRYDDKESPVKVTEAINELGQENIKLQVLLGSYPINKPNKLNYALRAATGNVIAIFDAEDEPHRDIYSIVNTILIRDKVDVVQSGVQLMNYESHWFSAFACLEYFFWFKSGLHFFTKVGHVSPLGGNTVFFKKRFLEKVKGWDDQCLTEDADIGFRLTLAGAKMKVIYDEIRVTREETPSTTEGFIQQRTRWIQGFLQILYKGDWKKLPEARQKLTAMYILIAPIIPGILILYTPIGLYIGLTKHLPIVLSMFSYLPSYLLFMIIVTQVVGLYEFTRAYKLSITFKHVIRLLLGFLPYLFTIAFASLRAVYRQFISETNWEKTAHLNLHRKVAKEV